MTGLGDDGRIHLGFATELPDALGNSVCVLLFFAGMFEELRSYGGRMNARGHEVMKLVAQHTDEFCRQRLVQNAYGLCTIQPVVFGHRAVFDLLARPGSNLLDIFQEMHRLLHSNCRCLEKHAGQAASRPAPPWSVSRDSDGLPRARSVSSP